MTEIGDLVELALRLQQVRTTPPPSLRPYLSQQRAAPREGNHPPRGAPARTGPLSGPQRQARQSAWNWRSKGPSS